MKSKPKRLMAILLCLLTVLGMIPGTTAFAASKVNINSVDKTDYFEFYNANQEWADLNTPQHYVEGDNTVAYCIQHQSDNPRGLGYSEISPLDSYSTRTINGIQIILENGYPCSTGGFTADQARYATANAIRFWLTEEGADGFWNFTNRAARPGSIRAKSGYQSLLDWADELLQMARDQKLMSHSVSFSPSSLSMSVSGDYFVGTTRVTLVNCSGGYTLDQSGLPSGSVVEGFTGKNGDTLTIKIPIANGGQSIRLDATGYDNRTTANLFWYAPDNSNYQRVITYTDGEFSPTADGVLRMSTPDNGKIEITKTDAANGAKLSGAVFGIYSDSGCSNLVSRVTIAANGVGTSGDLTAGTYYIKELTAPSGYVLNSKVYTAKVTAAATYSVTVPNTPQKGVINISKTNANTSLGTYSLEGAVFQILSGGTVVDTVTTDSAGKASSKELPLGTYTIREKTAPFGFVLAGDKTVTLSPGNQTATVVYGNVTVPETPQAGKITITKKDADTAVTLSGAVFEIYSGSKVVDTITTGADGTATSKNLPLGTYSVKEKTAPVNYVLSDEAHSVPLSYDGQTKEVVYAGVTATNEVQMGKIRVTKANSEPALGNHSLKGAVFSIKDSTGKVVDTITTDAAGKAESIELHLGTYSVEEVTAPFGFVLNSEAKAAKLTYAGQLIDVTYTDVTIANRPQTGKITVEKVNSNPVMGDYPLAKADFEIVDANGKVADTITTDNTGKATSKELPLGTYTVREKNAPYGYVLSKETKTVTLSYAGQTVETVYAETSIGNKPQTGTITVTKQDVETGATPQGDATLEGAKYVVKDSSGKVVDTLHALGSEKVTSKELPLGAYTVTETDPPTGYLLNPASQTVKLEYAGQNVEVTNIGTVIKDEVIRGRLHLVKFGSSELGSNELDPDLKPALEGVVFEMRLKSSGELYDTLTTDENGRATSDWLPYGTYVVTETAGVEGYMKVKPFEVFIHEDEETYDFLVEDDTVAMKIRLVKQDSATGKPVSLAGTTFRIEDANGKPVTFEILYPQPHTLSEFVTDESGTLYLPDELPYGEYRLIEVKAPEGYLLNTEPVTFKVTEEAAVNSVITIGLKNDVVKGKITVTKTGEQLTGAETKETAYGTQYIPKYTNKGLAGVTFEVIAAENIGTPDGTVYHNAGDVVCEITTGADGKATTGELYLGKYFVVEKRVPTGFVLDTTPYEVTLKYKDQHTAIVTESIGVENLRQKASAEIAKQAEYFDYENGVFYTDYGKGFVFGLYTGSAIGDIPANALVDVLTTGEDGKAVSKADLPLGEYYLKELKAPSDGYILLTGTAVIDLTAKNNTDAEFKAESSFFNEMYKKRIAVTKVDAADENRRLPLAMFEVLSADGKTVVTTFATNAKGYGESCELPIGEYILRERTAPHGFVLSDEEIKVDLTKDSPAVTKFSMENAEVKGKITVEKTGEQLAGFEKEETDYGTQYIPIYENKGLAGVVFEVTAARDIVSFDGIEYYKKGEKVCELTTGADGKASTELLPLGEFLVTEKSGVSGFVMDSTPHTVKLCYKGQNVPVVTETLQLKNTRQKAAVELNKTAEYFNSDTAEFYEDAGAGFVFGLYTAQQIGDAPADALVDILRTNELGMAKSTVDLPLGKFYLKELAAGSTGYILADTIEIDLTGNNAVDTVILARENAHNEMFKKRVAVVKTDANDSERGLAGAVFEVLDESGDKALCTFVTDENGYGESCELPVSTVLLRERSAPTGFVLTDEVYTVELKHDSPEIVKIEVENKPTEVILEKTDITTGDAVPGAAIEIYDESGMVVFAGVTNSDGSVIIHELPAGTFTWKERVSPLGFAINTAEFTFTIDEYGNVTGDTEITDEPTALTVKKINDYDGSPMPGVEFTLNDADGNPVNLTKTEEGRYIPGGNSPTFAVGEDGTAEVRYLPVGDYTLTEHTPDGFISKGTFELTITDENGIENPCGVVVYNAPTAFKLFKVHAETGAPLTGAGFTFKTKAFLGFNTLKFTKLENGWYEYDEQGDVTEIMVDANGEIAILGLPLDTEIFIEETTVPTGFFPIPAQKIVLTVDNVVELPLEVTIENSPGVKLGIDSDKYNVLIAIGITLLGVGVVVWRVAAAKKALKKKKEDNE